jgi:hypothetical protein
MILFLKIDKKDNPEDLIKVSSGLSLGYIWCQMNHKHNYAIKSMELEVIVIEQILRVCFNKSRFDELFDAIRGIVSFSRYILKKYLFYLIETGILSYHGESQAYIITLEGLNLLYFLNTEKWEGQSGIKNIVICLWWNTFVNLNCHHYL